MEFRWMVQAPSPHNPWGEHGSSCYLSTDGHSPITEQQTSVCVSWHQVRATLKSIMSPQGTKTPHRPRLTTSMWTVLEIEYLVLHPYRHTSELGYIRTNHPRVSSEKDFLENHLSRAVTAALNSAYLSPSYHRVLVCLSPVTPLMC